MCGCVCVCVCQFGLCINIPKEIQNCLAILEIPKKVFMNRSNVHLVFVLIQQSQVSDDDYWDVCDKIVDDHDIHQEEG